MKRERVLRIVVFAGVFLALFCGVSALLKPVWPEWNNYNRTLGYYEEPDDHVETIFLGASIMVNGVIPAELYEDYGICSYNLGSEVQPVAGSYYWLREAYRTQGETLRTVVYDVSSLRYGHDDDDAACKKPWNTCNFPKSSWRLRSL